jgi:single-stranded-DNA-specific exonuclease
VELLRAARIDGVPRASEIAFGVAPRLNAVGRMGGAEDAVKLLLTRDAQEAQMLAERVEALNQSRKVVQAELLNQLPPPNGDAFDLVVLEGAHKGVLGIVAARRMRESGLPTGVGCVLDGTAHCSLRAPEGYDLTDLLAMAKPFLRSGGGHRAAAGITFEASRLPFVRQALARGAASQASNRVIAGLPVDGQGAGVLPLAEDLVALEPFGQGFPEPLVVMEGRLPSPSRGFGQGHRKFKLEGVREELTWFFGEEWASELDGGHSLRFAVSPQDHARWGRSWRVETLLGREEIP